jgi:hypothetical protein
MIVQPFNGENCPHSWVLEKELKVATLQELLGKFYEELDYGFYPLAWAYNPEKEGKPMYPDQHVVVVPFRLGFRVIIDRHGRFIGGPHAAMLYYKCYQIEDVVWVATLQLEAMFFNDQAMKDALSTAITNREFFHSEKTGQTIITL